MGSLLNNDFIFDERTWTEPSGLCYYLANNLDECIQNVIAATKGKQKNINKMMDAIIDHFGVDLITDIINKRHFN